MARIPIIVDSWDHYNDEALKWTGGSIQTIDLTGTLSRTGIGCLLFGSGSEGPFINTNPMTAVIAGSAFYPDQLTGGGHGYVMEWSDAISGNRNVRLAVESTGAVSVYCRNDPIEVQIAVSAPGLVVPSVYNYLEIYATISNSARVVVRCNGAVVIDVSGVVTIAPGSGAFVDRFKLLGLGGAASSRHDDTYFDDPNDEVANFRGAVRIYAEVPFADGAPTQWAPSTGVTSFNLVDEIPQNDDTDYISSDTIGEATQLLFNLAGVPPFGEIQTVQHVQDLKLSAAGSRSVSSLCNGSVSNPAALTTNYHMYRTLYDTNPATGQVWDGTADFPAQFGAQVTA